jgi:hypothetical protein
MRLPSFRWRSSRMTFVAHHTGRADHFPPPPPPPPQPRELVDVVGVGQTETVNGVALTLLSVERYREGYVVLFRMFRHRKRSERDLPTPHFELALTPESPTPYRFWMMGGTGGGGTEGEMEYRQSYAIVPRPSDATETVIEVSQISWKRYGSGTYKIVSVDPGPWRFAIGH